MGGVIANANKAKIPFVSTFSGMVPGIMSTSAPTMSRTAFSPLPIAARIDGEGES